MEVRDFSEMSIEWMTDLNNSRAFIISCLSSGDSLPDAIRHGITAMGIEEFSEKSGIQNRRIVAFAHGNAEFKPDTLARCLAVFGLPLVTTLRKATK